MTQHDPHVPFQAPSLSAPKKLHQLGVFILRGVGVEVGILRIKRSWVVQLRSYP